MTIKIATVKVFDRDFEEWETHHGVIAIIEQADFVILLHTNSMWSMLNKLRFDINQPVWKTYKASMEETKNVTFEQ